MNEDMRLRARVWRLVKRRIALLWLVPGCVIFGALAGALLGLFAAIEAIKDATDIEPIVFKEAP